MIHRCPCDSGQVFFSEFFYYESIKIELNIRLIYECRCDERLKGKSEGSTRLGYTGCCGLKIQKPVSGRSGG